jgi:hypothetical protein
MPIGAIDKRKLNFSSGYFYKLFPPIFEGRYLVEIWEWPL